jgi:hypothetical protein
VTALVNDMVGYQLSEGLRWLHLQGEVIGAWKWHRGPPKRWYPPTSSQGVHDLKVLGSFVNLLVGQLLLVYSRKSVI